VLTDARHQLVEAASILCIHPAAVQALAFAQGFTAGLLRVHHLHRRIGWVKPFGLTLRQPLGDHRIGCLAVEDEERHSGGFRRLPGVLALLLFQVRGVDHYGEACLQRGGRELVQMPIGRIAGLLGINAGIELALLFLGLLPVQPLAFDIRAQAYRTQSLDQAQCNVAFAHG